MLLTYQFVWLFACFANVAGATEAPAFRGLALEPAPIQLLTSPAVRVGLCALEPATSSTTAVAGGWHWRWRYEGCIGVVAGDRQGQLPKLAPASLHSATDSSSPFDGVFDAGSGRLTVNGSGIEHSTTVRPQCRLYCEAASTDGSSVIQSRRSELLIVNPRSIEANIACSSGPATGTAVCSLKSNPLSADAFSVIYYRRSFASIHEERLLSSADRPKYASFGQGFNKLHIMNLSAEDVRYSYFARLALVQPDGRQEFVATTRNTAPIKLLSIPLLGVTQRSRDSAAVQRMRVARQLVSGADLLLPCYASNAVASVGQYSWLKDNSTLDLASSSGKYSLLLPGSGDGSLRLRPESRRRDSGIYSCLFNGQAVQEIELELYSPLSANIADAISSNLNVDFGASISIACQIAGSHIDSVRWLHNGRPAPPPGSEQRQSGNLTVLTIVRAGRRHAGVYQCLLERRQRSSGGSGDHDESVVPFDSAQASVFLTVNKLPPALTRKVPDIANILIHLNGSDPRSRGSLTCRFESQKLPLKKFYLDGSQELFGSYARRGIFRVQTEDFSNGALEVQVDFHVIQLKHTGTLTIETENSFGTSSCSIYLLGITEPPRLQVRPLADMHALVDGSFVIDCHVLGGLNSRQLNTDVAGSLSQQQQQQLRVPTYQLSWHLFLDGNSQPLKLPRNHRTQVDNAAKANRLLVTQAEPQDSGKYTCTVTPVLDSLLMQQQQQQTPHHDILVASSLSASAQVKVVPGIRAKELNKQHDLDSEMSISDTCRPVNQQTDVWYAWWEFVNASDHSRNPAKLILLDSKIVKYLAIHGGSQHSDSSCQRSGLTDRFAKVGVPDEVRSNWAQREANLHIRHPWNLKYQGVFTCRIVNCYDQVALTRRVKYKEEYRFKPGSPPNRREVLLGSSLTVHCELTQSGQGTPALVWYRGNAVRKEKRVPIYSTVRSQISSNSRIYQFPNGTLHIVRIERRDSSFLCATDVVNKRHLRSASFNPSILVPAIVKPFETNRLVLIAGTNDTIGCEFEGDKPVKIEWIGFYEGGRNAQCRLGPEQADSNENCQPDRIFPLSASASPSYSTPRTSFASISVSEDGSRLILTNVNRGVRGRYNCQASNRHSPEGRPSYQSINVHVVERPGPVGSFSHTGYGHDWVMLQWEPPPQAFPASGNDLSSYQLTYRLLTDPDEIDSLQLENLTETVNIDLPAEDKSYRVEGLRPGGSYEFNLVAKNAAGSSPSVACRADTRARAPSGPARQLLVRPIGPTALRVAWSPPDAAVRNGRISDYSLAVRRLPASDREAECIAASADVADSTVRCPGPVAIIGNADHQSSTPACHGAAALPPLQAGTVYQVRLAPLNSAGAGPPVCAVARTPETTPSFPMNVSCESADSDGHALLVSWLPPPTNLGHSDEAVIEYQVQIVPTDDALVENESRLIEMSVQPDHFPDRGQQQKRLRLADGLQAYTSYSFTVTAANTNGRSARSHPPAVCRTRPGRPPPPEDLKVFGADNGRGAVAAWRVCPPDRANGRLVSYRLRYECYSGCRGAHDQPIQVDVPADGWSHYAHKRIANLSLGASYKFCISALVESVGEGERSPHVYLDAVEMPPLAIVSFSHRYKVAKGSRLMLDCYAVNQGSEKLNWKHPPLDQSPTEHLKNGSALISQVLTGGTHSCGTADARQEVKYTIELLELHTNPTPPAPDLLPGRSSPSSLEVVWRPRGIGLDSLTPADVSSRSRLREFELHSRIVGDASAESVRVLPATNRSFALSPLPCGTEVDFRLRAVNVGGLKSNFSQTLRLRAPGSAPVLAATSSPTAHRLARLSVGGRSVDFNLSGVLPGDHCPPALYRLALLGDLVEPTAVELTPQQLVGGCCYSLPLTLQHQSGAGARHQTIRYSVVARNAAGNLSVVDEVVEKFDSSAAASSAAAADSGGQAGSVILGASGKQLLHRRPPQSPPPPPHRLPPRPDVVVGADAAERQPWPNWWQQVALVSALAMLLLLGLMALATALLCRRQQRRPADSAAAAPAAGVGATRRVRSCGNRSGGRQQQQQQPKQQQQQQQPVPPPRMQKQKAEPPTPSQSKPAPAPSVPYEYEDDRESVDSRGNIRAYATFDADKGGSTGGGRRRQQQQQSATSRLRRAAYENGAARRIQQQPLHLATRFSRVSSATTLSSNHDELVEAYHRAQQRRALPPTESYDEEEAEHSGGSSGATDPGIRRFTCRPPDPNETRRAACEMPRSSTDPAVQPPTSRRPLRDCRTPRSATGAPTDMTYESIDEPLLPPPPPPPESAGAAAQQPSASTKTVPHSHRRLPPAPPTESGYSYGTTGVYEPADSLAASTAYGYGAWRRQEQPVAMAAATNNERTSGAVEQTVSEADNAEVAVVMGSGADAEGLDPTYDTRNILLV